MYILPEQTILDEKQLKMLNEYLDNIVKERELLPIDWEELQYLMEKYCIYSPRIHDRAKSIPSMKKEEIIKVRTIVIPNL